MTECSFARMERGTFRDLRPCGLTLAYYFAVFLDFMTLKRHFTRRSFIKTLGTAASAAPFVTSGLMAQPPSKMVRHASFGASNQAGRDIFEMTKFPEVQLVAVAEVDLSRTQRL